MDGDFSSHQDDFKTCSCHFQFSLHISVREKFNALCEIQVSKLFINNNWSLKSILGFVLLQFLFIITVCEQFQIYWYSEILSSWWSQEEWLKKSKSIANLCFCSQSDVRDADTCLQPMKKHQLPAFVSGSFSHVPSERASLTVTQEQIQLTWLGSIWCILSTLNFTSSVKWDEWKHACGVAARTK